MAKRNWNIKDRTPVKVKVSESEVQETPTEDIETPVDTVVENEIPATEEAEVVNTPVEEKKVKKTSEIKEYTEEELAVMPREQLYAVIEDIKAGKARCKPRFINR